MKTIYTCLPIYDRLSKQCYERATHAKNSGIDKPVPTITSRHRLPSFQWLDDGDGAASVSAIELIDIDGETYNAPIRYAGWVNTSFDTLTTSGLNITSAIVLGASNKVAYLTPETWLCKAGETIRVKGTLTYNSTGTAVKCNILISNGAETYNEDIDAGNFEVTYTFLADGVAPDEVYVSLRSGWGPKSFTVSDIEVTIDRINQWFPALPALYTDGTSTWFTYDGDTLNYLLPAGVYYLKITMNTGHVYYSEWFLVDCVYENLITSWVNQTYETFTSSGTIITSAINSVASASSSSNSFTVRKGESITVIFYFTKNSGTLPLALIYNTGWTTHVSSAIAEGLNVVTLTSTWDGDAYFAFYNNATNVNFSTSEIIVIRSYSEKYLTINFTHSCNLGDIYYEGGLTQTLFLESETMEPVFPYTEKGAENGFGQFVPTWQRQEKNQLIRTNLIPQYIVEVLHRLKLHDTITLIDLVGDGFTVEEIETEHDWQFDDKYYAMAKITVDLGETIVITGCCTAVNVC